MSILFTSQLNSQMACTFLHLVPKICPKLVVSLTLFKGCETKGYYKFVNKMLLTS